MERISISLHEDLIQRDLISVNVLNGNISFLFFRLRSIPSCTTERDLISVNGSHFHGETRFQQSRVEFGTGALLLLLLLLRS